MQQAQLDALQNPDTGKDNDPADNTEEDTQEPQKAIDLLDLNQKVASGDITRAIAINILSFEILVPCIAVLYVLSEVTNNVL